MSNILAQMNPMAMMIVALLLVLSLASVVVLRLVRKGRAKSTGDLVKIARERAAAAKETKAATKRAEAAIAEPVALSRLSRISAKGMAEASAERPDAIHDADDHPVDYEPFAESLAEPLAESPSDALAEHDEPAGQDYGLPTDDTPSVSGAPFAFDDADDIAPALPAGDEGVSAEAEEDFEADFEADRGETAEPDLADIDDIADIAETADAPIDLDAIDLADPANHPTDWDGLLAIVDRLDSILAQPWHSDMLAEPIAAQLAEARAAAGENSAKDPLVRALSRDSAAIDLARTINNAAREQAAEIVAAVREFAHQHSFSSDDCRAVLGAMQQIEWMAVIARDDRLERRTLPLTRHDPEAPLWVADALDDLRVIESRAAA